MKKRIIKARNVSYSYPVSEEFEEGEKIEITDTKEKIKALDDVNIDIEEGQFICILGSNGSGKSTLARHMNALICPDEGSVWINDMLTADDANIWDIRSDVGMIFQNPDNQMVASQIDEEVAFGLENMGIPSEEIVDRVKQALNSVRMQNREKDNPNNLSGGQKQRVAIASIIAMQPKCIILDESTAMLDPLGRKEIMDTVLRLNQESKITVICITHYMEEAIEADKVFVMSNGHVDMFGTPREIFSQEERIEKAGLQLPVICQIAKALRNRGIEIPQGILTAEELIHALQ